MHRVHIHRVPDGRDRPDRSAKAIMMRSRRAARMADRHERISDAPRRRRGR
jgi:hypothetical protein